LQYLPLLNHTTLTPAPKGSYGSVTLSPVAPLLNQNIRQSLGKEPIRSRFPLTFEQIGQRYGFVLYETTLAWPVSDPALFSVPGISDRAIVLLDDVSFNSYIHYCHTLMHVRNMYHNFFNMQTVLDIL
jgi:beta-galactosidase